MSARRILVVDDEPDIRDVARMSLEGVGGYEVLSAGSGAEGVEIAAAERPDLILLDVMMPGMDGPATLERLRAGEATRDLPVIFLTAKVQGSDLRRLEELGARATIAKPFDPMRISDQVAEAMGWTA